MRNTQHWTLAVSLLFGSLTSLTSDPAQAQVQNFRLKSFRLPNLCFDVANNRVANGTSIQVAKCKQKGHPAQTWTQGALMNPRCAPAMQECLYQIKLAANPKYCIDYTNSTKPPGAGSGLQLWLCRDPRYGDSAYWGSTLGQSAEASVMYPAVPNVGIFGGFSPSISLKAREGERIALIPFSTKRYYYWVTEYTDY